MTSDEFHVAFTRVLDEIRRPEDGGTNRRTTPDDELKLAERTFDLVCSEWATIPSYEQLVRALVNTARLSSIDARTRALMRRLSPPVAKESFMMFFTQQLERDSQRGSTQIMRLMLEGEIETFTKNLWMHIMRLGALRRTVLIPFFLRHPHGFPNEQACAEGILALVCKS